MIGVVAYLAVILAGTGYAAYHDLKTSEVPDSISLFVGGTGLVYHLATSFQAPYGLLDALLAGGAILTMAAVGAYLRLGTGILEDNFGDHHWGQKLLDIYHADLWRLRVSDILGTALLVSAGAAFFLTTLHAGVTPVVASFLAGMGVFAIGWTLFLLGVWGGADAFVLGAVGFALPQLPAGIEVMYGFNWPFPIALVFTVFFIGAIYSLVYAAAVTVLADGAIAAMVDAIKQQRVAIMTLTGAYILGIGIMGAVLYHRYMIDLEQFLTNAGLFLVAILAAYGLHIALKHLEEEIMTHTIPAGKLAAGDVLAEPVELTDETIEDARIEGLTEHQVEAIQMERDEVAVKTGVRFIPAFPLTIIVLVTVGDVLSAIVATVLA